MEWLEKSPCEGCICLDEDEMPIGDVMAPVQYCSIVTNLDVFFANLYGEDKDGKHMFLDCPHKQYE